MGLTGNIGLLHPRLRPRDLRRAVRRFSTLVASSLIQDFWWSKGDDQSRERHWKSWNAVTILKEDGGLGFQDLLLFNEALILKQLWRGITNPNLFVSKILKGKYFSKGSLLQAKISYNASWMCRNWLKLRDKHQKGF